MLGAAALDREVCKLGTDIGSAGSPVGLSCPAIILQRCAYSPWVGDGCSTDRGRELGRAGGGVDGLSVSCGWNEDDEGELSVTETRDTGRRRACVGEGCRDVSSSKSSWPLPPFLDGYLSDLLSAPW